MVSDERNAPSSSPAGPPTHPDEPARPLPAASEFDDPRVSDASYRNMSRKCAPIALVGVVHGHPASVGRVRTVLDRIDPAVLALELPPGALSLYRRESRSVGSSGDELLAAIRNAPNSRLVGLDGPSPSMIRRLARRAVGDRPPSATVGGVVRTVGTALRTVLACRLATLPGAPLPDGFENRRAVAASFDCEPTASPAEQARHERAHVTAVRALLAGTTDPAAATGSSPTTATAYRDRARERQMAERLDATRRRSDGPIVAVVGVDHVDSVERLLVN